MTYSGPRPMASLNPAPFEQPALFLGPFVAKMKDSSGPIKIYLRRLKRLPRRIEDGRPKTWFYKERPDTPSTLLERLSLESWFGSTFSCPEIQRSL